MLAKETESNEVKSGKGRGSNKSCKKLVATREVKINVDAALLKEGAIFKGYEEFWVQNLIITTEVVLYKRARYQQPDGSYITADLPAGTNDHFGEGLKHYIVNQYHTNNVPFDKIHQDLQAMGIQISAGKINSIAMQAVDTLEPEHDAMVKAGMQTAQDIRMDDTGGRHQGKNHSYVVMQNDLFACFKSINSKSRIDILRALQNNKNITYALNGAAIDYLNAQKCTPEHIDIIQQHLGTIKQSYLLWKQFLKSVGIDKYNTSKLMLKLLEEAALLGGAIENGLHPQVVLLSDGAPQYAKMLTHAMCWIHAERLIKRLVVPPEHAQELEKIRGQFWDFYKELKAYKDDPMPQKQLDLSHGFDKIFLQSAENQDVLVALRNLHKHKDELLCILNHPTIPLHNNSSENDIRTLVIKRKISGTTRSDRGRDARAIFASIIKTCRKLGISPWKFIGDRLSFTPQMPSLAKTIYERVAATGPPV